MRVLQHRGADELGADRLAYKRARPVASDEVVAFDRCARTAIEVDGARGHALLALHQIRDLGAMHDADARLLRSVREQHWLEELLIAAVCVLGCRPGRVQPGCGRCSTRAARRNENAGEFDAGDARRRDDVVGIVCRQPDAAQLVGHSELPENLHGAGADLAALHVWRIVGRAALGDDDIDASPGQIHGQRQSHRPAADDQHPGFHTKFLKRPMRGCVSKNDITSQIGGL